MAQGPLLGTEETNNKLSVFSLQPAVSNTCSARLPFHPSRMSCSEVSLGDVADRAQLLLYSTQ